MKEERKLRLTRLITCASFLALSLSCKNIANADDSSVYQPKIISDISVVTTDNDSYNISLGADNVRVRYSISYQTNSYGSANSLSRTTHRSEHVKNVMIEASQGVIAYLERLNIEPEACKGSAYNINIFIVNQSIMRDRSRFVPVLGRNTPIVVQGFYDATKGSRNNSAILITNIHPDVNDGTIHHEMAHYWWDRACVGEYWPGNTEDFAMSYQRYYERGL